MRAIIISDLHLGSSHCRLDALEDFLRLVPDDCRLVLNGDTLDDPRQSLPPRHAEMLDLLRTLSARIMVIWIRGNHDDGFDPGGDFVIVPSYQIDDQIEVLHGDAFDSIMPRYRWFLALFKRLHDLRMKLGARPVHVAGFAKMLKPLYAFLCRHVRLNAIQHANEQGIRAITCGHVHKVEDTMHRGCRYLNTGCWTELETAAVLVDGDAISLVRVDDCIARGSIFP